MSNSLDIKHWQNFYSEAKVITAITYGRSGLAFFKRLFDQHPQFVSITLMFYEYHDLRVVFHDNKSILSSDFYDFAVSDSGFADLSKDLTEPLREKIIYMGDDPDAPFDRQLVRSCLKKIVFQDKYITRKKALLSMHFAYAVGLGRDVSKLKGIIMTESVKGQQDKFMFEWFKEDFKNHLLIHLARDIKSSYTSLKTLYSNSFGSLYPLAYPELINSVNCNSLTLWILKNLYEGGNLIQWASENLPEDTFITIKNEDLNSNFKVTMKKLSQAGSFDWITDWDSNNYVPSSLGTKWLGFSAYSKSSEKINNGPIANLNLKNSRVSSPSAEVNSRWNFVTQKCEIMLLESIFRREIIRIGYEPNNKDNLTMTKFKMILLSFTLVKGELPHLRWFLTSRKTHFYRDIIIRLSYFFLFPLFYVWSRFYIIKFLIQEEFVLNKS